MPATFSVEATFSITGRGFIVAGQITDGQLRLGSRVVLPDPAAANGVRLEHVTSVEVGHGRRDDGTPFSFVGLLLGELPAGEAAALRERLAAGTLLEVSDPDPDFAPPVATAPAPAARGPWWKFWSGI